MKNRRLIFAVALMLSFVMMFGTFSAYAAEDAQEPITDTQMEDYYDGYEDGYFDGYNDGYGNGYNDGFNNGLGYGSDSQPAFPSIFDFITELRWRLEELMDEIKDYIIDALMIDFPAPNFDSAYLPVENQAVLGADALALCEEFNAMVEAARYVTETTTVTKTANVDFQVTGQKQGLSAQEARARLEKYGPNRLAEGKKKSLIRRFFEELADPITG